MTRSRRWLEVVGTKFAFGWMRMKWLKERREGVLLYANKEKLRTGSIESPRIDVLYKCMGIETECCPLGTCSSASILGLLSSTKELSLTRQTCNSVSHSKSQASNCARPDLRICCQKDRQSQEKADLLPWRRPQATPNLRDRCTTTFILISMSLTNHNVDATTSLL